MTTNRFWIHKADERSQQITTFAGRADAQDQAAAYARQGWAIEWVGCDRTADALTHLEWARDCYAEGIGQAVEDQIAYLRAVIDAERSE